MPSDNNINEELKENTNANVLLNIFENYKEYTSKTITNLIDENTVTFTYNN
jgi:hypothetical protein